jgi:hypothetical protein
LQVTFDGSASSDPDDGIASWSLQFGDGSSTSRTGAPPSSIAHTYSSPATYTAKLIVADGHGVQSSATVQITVNAQAGPTARTDSATGVSETTATLNGTANPKGQASFAWFEYGPTTNYGASTDQQSLGHDKVDYSVSASVSGLTPATTYHYRIVVKNQAGQTSYGADTTFNTKGASPTSTTQTDTPAIRRFELKDTSVKATRAHVVTLHVACPSFVKGSCLGGVILRALLKGKGHLANGRPNVKRQRIGSGHFAIRPGTVAPVRVKLTNKGFRLLVRKKKLRAEATVIAVDNGGGVTAAAWSIKPIITVRAPGA